MKKILITSGGTREYIDDVRVLTNISSGKLGALCADEFLGDNSFLRHMPPIINYEVHHVFTKGSAKADANAGWYHQDYIMHEVTDVQSVYDKMKELVPEMDVVIHCMAVSDFAFKPISTKLKSNDPLAFIESMKERIYQTPKILKEIKTWNPNCKLISFKFEVGLTPEELIEVATKSGLDNNCDIVIANDKAQMTKEKKHIAYAIDPHNIENQVILYNKQEIAEFIYNQIK